MVNVLQRCPKKLKIIFRDGQAIRCTDCFSFEGRIEDGELTAPPLARAGGIKKSSKTLQNFLMTTFVVLCGDALIDLDLTEAVSGATQEKGANAPVW